MATKLDRVMNYLDELLPIKSHHLWSRDRVRSRGKLKSLYLHFQSAYGHQTLQEGNIP